MRLTRPDSAVLLSGLAIRLSLAPFTGHPGDLALFVTSQRLFYQTGRIDLQYFPTLPAVYYVQLVFYAPYQLLRLAGMPDFQSFYNTTLVIEGTFLKLPLILGDVGIFLVLLRFTRKLLPATLFFLNPFPICLSAVWGTYDSLMLFPLVLGLYIFATKGDTAVPSLAFVISGLLKLFGFVVFALVVCESIASRRFHRDLLVGVLGGVGVAAVTLSPVFLFGDSQSFLQVLVYRFMGLSIGSGATQYGLLGDVLKMDPSGVLPTLPVAVTLTCLGLSYESVKLRQPRMLLLVKWTLVAAVAFSVVSASQPQWLSWLIPRGILYGSLDGRTGLQYFAYTFGAFETFLTITLLQGSAYMLVGNAAAFVLGYVESVPGSIFLYAVMTTLMIVIFCGYAFSKRLRSFRQETFPLIMLLFLSAYFWIVVVGAGRVFGVS